MTIPHCDARNCRDHLDTQKSEPLKPCSVIWQGMELLQRQCFFTTPLEKAAKAMPSTRLGADLRAVGVRVHGGARTWASSSQKCEK